MYDLSIYSTCVLSSKALFDITLKLLKIVSKKPQNDNINNSFHIQVWDTCYPTSLKYKNDMRKCAWKYTQFSQFNSSDTLLLVSGVHFGSLSTSGEIAVFSLEGRYQQFSQFNSSYTLLLVLDVHFGSLSTLGEIAVSSLEGRYQQFSQINSSDTLLLVSGVHFGSLSTSGEVAVFSLEGRYQQFSQF